LPTPAMLPSANRTQPYHAKNPMMLGDGKIRSKQGRR
jgi:hypothetical protein